MSNDYTLKIRSALGPRPVLELLTAALELDAPLEPSGKALFVGTDLINIGARRVHDGDHWARVEGDIIEEGFGFRPTLSVNFKPLRPWEGDDDSFRLADESYRLMQRGVFELLRHDPGDAVLLYNGESVVLQRLEGRLELNQTWSSEWSDEDLAVLDPLP